MNKRDLYLFGAGLVFIQILVGCGLFVTQEQMYAYAAPKNDISMILKKLDRIELKLDKLMGY